MRKRLTQLGFLARAHHFKRSAAARSCCKCREINQTPMLQVPALEDELLLLLICERLYRQDAGANDRGRGGGFGVEDASTRKQRKEWQNG